MRERLESYRQMLGAQLRLLYREPEFLFWAFLFPVLLTVGLGIAFRERPPEPVVVGLVEGPGAEELARRLGSAPELRVERTSEAEGLQRLRRGRIALLLWPGAEPPRVRLDPTRPDATLARLQLAEVLTRTAAAAPPPAALAL